jgi:hypothetical protein
MLDSVSDKLTKRCTKCGEIKSLSEFHKRSKGSRDGYEGTCKPCRHNRMSGNRNKLKEAGCCIIFGCNERKYGKYRMCERHYEQQRVKLHNKQEKRREKGLCIQCGKRPPEKGLVMCASCNKRHSLRHNVKKVEFNNKVGDYYNNECAICHLVSNDYEMFDCHHLDPPQKQFRISAGLHKDFETLVVPEMEKCVYLDAN